MKVAISMVRDEKDIISYTLDHMLKSADRAIILDNGSVDGTREIIEDYSDRVKLVIDSNHEYYQSTMMTHLAYLAGEMGAEWIFPFDADEAWTIHDDWLEDADIINMSSHVYVPHKDDDNNEINPLKRINHRTSAAEPLPKVAFRYHPDVRLHMGNHGVDTPFNRHKFVQGMRHYQYRSYEQLKRKVRQGTQAVEATVLPTSTCMHWRNLAVLSDLELESWWNSYVSQPEMVYDPYAC